MEGIFGVRGTGNADSPGYGDISKSSDLKKIISRFLTVGEGTLDFLKGARKEKKGSIPQIDQQLCQSDIIKLACLIFNCKVKDARGFEYQRQGSKTIGFSRFSHNVLAYNMGVEVLLVGDSSVETGEIHVQSLTKEFYLYACLDIVNHRLTIKSSRIANDPFTLLSEILISISNELGMKHTYKPTYANLNAALSFTEGLLFLHESGYFGNERRIHIPLDQENQSNYLELCVIDDNTFQFTVKLIEEDEFIFTFTKSKYGFNEFRINSIKTALQSKHIFKSLSENLIESVHKTILFQKSLKIARLLKQKPAGRRFIVIKDMYTGLFAHILLKGGMVENENYMLRLTLARQKVVTSRTLAPIDEFNIISHGKNELLTKLSGNSSIESAKKSELVRFLHLIEQEANEAGDIVPNP